MPQNVYVLAKIGVDTSEKDPSKVLTSVPAASSLGRLNSYAATFDRLKWQEWQSLIIIVKPSQ